MLSVKILIADNDRMFSQHLSNYLDAYGYTKLYHAYTKQETLDLAVKLEPELILLDLNITGSCGSGLLVIYQLGRKVSAKIIVLTTCQQSVIVRDAFALGVANYLSKQEYVHVPQIIATLDKPNNPLTVLTHDYMRLRQEAILSRLTRAERQVFRLVIDSLSTSQIAKKLVKEESTIKSQIRSILRKFDVESRADAVHLLASQTITRKYKK